MPLIANAKKALRRDRRRTAFNQVTKLKQKNAIKDFLEKMSFETLSVAYRHIDRSVKKNLMHKNKAAHMKSALAKQLKAAGKPVKPLAKKVTAKTVKKAAPKKAAVKKTAKKATPSKTAAKKPSKK